MARQKNPERIARENMVTRSIRIYELSFRYVPKGGNTIERDVINMAGNEQTVLRNATAYARTKGTLIDEVKIQGYTERLYGMEIDNFISRAVVLEEIKG